jgi:carbamoyl-phosphate synthase small subunit
MSEKPKGMLVLEDGSTFIGESLGASGEWFGEVVFDTGMTGYQEVITDPSCCGQMVVFTCPHIGNVGVNCEDAESARPHAMAVLARKICEHPSNWRSQQSLPEYLRAHGVPALSGLDTRRLTLTLRDKGTMRGALSTVNLDREYLLEKARSTPDISELDLVDQVTIAEARPWAEPLVSAWTPSLAVDSPAEADRPHVVVIDCGVKHSILRYLVRLGARVTLVPANATRRRGAGPRA